MKHEKSCGALVIRKQNGKTQLLILKHKFGGHWSFPKGHVEAGETERQTAIREVREETGLSIRIREGFRQSVQYFPQPGVRKQVVYFLAEAMPGPTVPQEEEISEIRWIDLEDALDTVTFRNDKNLIRAVQDALGLDFRTCRPLRENGEDVSGSQAKALRPGPDRPRQPDGPNRRGRQKSRRRVKPR